MKRGFLRIGFDMTSEAKLYDNKYSHSDKDIKTINLEMKSQARTKTTEEDQLRMPKPITEKQINLEVEIINKFGLDKFTGGYKSHLAFKTPTSFLIATQKKGLKVIEEEKKLYAGELPSEIRRMISVVIFIDHLNCYLLYARGIIFRKDVDSRPPYFFMRLVGTSTSRGDFRYSKLNRKVVFGAYSGHISTLNIERKQLEMQMKKVIGGNVCDFKNFGKREEGVACLTTTGEIFLYFLNYEMKKLCAVTHAKINLENHKKGSSISICDKNRYLCIEIDSYQQRKVLLFELRNRSLFKRASFDLDRDSRCSKSLGKGYYLGDLLLWVGLSKWKSFVYLYDAETGVFKKLEEQIIAHKQVDPGLIHRVGGHFYYSGNVPYLMKLEIQT